jgi:signal transduction histidine kinase
MTGPVGTSSYDVGVWAALTRRFSPFLDLTVGVVAAVLSVVALRSADVTDIDPRLEAADPLAVVATAVAGLSLIWRRTHPVASFTVFLTASTVVTLPGHYIGLLSILLLLSLYSLSAHGRRRDGVIGLLVSIAVFVGAALLDVPDLHRSDLLQAWGLLVTAWALGDAIRSRRSHQAERLRAAEQEAATAREQAARGIVEERLRIARELHDVVAHSMSLIAVQAGVGGHVIRSDVDAAERALEIIAETSRRALTQTRSMLGLLRDQDTDPAEPPMQTIGDLATLLTDVGDAGVAAELSIRGTPRPLDPSVELAAYRVVQESLTNVLKHSTATRAEVQVTYADDGVDVEVHDSGRGARRPSEASSAPSGGHGLVGLGERTRLLGGAIDYGPAQRGGFRVSVHLPSGPVPVSETVPERVR